MSKKSFLRSVILGCAALLAGCQDTQPQQFSYFKDSVKNRVFVVQMRDQASSDQVLQLAKARMNTAGQFTAVYVFEVNVPAPVYDVSQSASFPDAMDAMHLPGMDGWRWLYLVKPSGQVEFTDRANAS
jgi:hypothetical protein